MQKLMMMLVAMHTRIAERDRGATATEYALLVALIALVIVGGVTIFGNQLDKFFSTIGNHLGSTF